MIGRRIRLGTAVAIVAALGWAHGAAAASCSARRDACEAICTPDRIASYYLGSWERCRTSCEPRWNQCLRTGVWVDLERLSTGTLEPAERY